MHIMPELIIDGVDASRYLLSAHCEMTANGSKDPGKYDLTLANVGGLFFGAIAPKSIEQTEQEQSGIFPGGLAPKKKVSLRMISTKFGCEENAQNIVTIFSGEIQKAEADEVFLHIEGSCTEGGMASMVKIPKTWEPGTDIITMVNDLLDLFGGVPASKRHIYPMNNLHPDKTPEEGDVIDFDTAMYEVSQQAQSIYFFDENDDFWFVPAADFRGFSDLTGNILRGSSASNMVGHCNHVDVYGGSYNPLPSEPGSEIKTHQLIYAFAEAPEWEIAQDNGLMKAPPVYVPNINQEEAQKIADNLLQWYRQYKDVPTVKVVGKAPGLLSKVAYLPWNGSMPPVACGGNEEAQVGLVEGLVVRRVVDISADVGFVCSLDVATSFMAAGVYAGDADDYRSDPAIMAQPAGVVKA